MKDKCERDGQNGKAGEAARLVLGTAQLGLAYGVANVWGQPDQALADRIVATAWAEGLKEFDTAQGYGDAEEVLGRALAGAGLADRAGLVSKLHPDLNLLDETAVVKAVEASLKRLGLARLQGLLLHREESLDLLPQGLGLILAGLVRRGLVERLGVSVYSPLRARAALDLDLLEIIQLPTNILDRRFERAQVFDLAQARGKSVYLRSVFLQGLLLLPLERLPARLGAARPYLTQAIELAQSLGLSLAELALGYVKAAFPWARVIIGAERPEQVAENARLWRRHVPPEVVDRVRLAFPDTGEEILNPVLWPK